MNGSRVVDSVVRTHQGSETARGSISQLTAWRILVEKRGYVFKSLHSTSLEGAEFGLSIVEEMASTYGQEIKVTNGDNGSAGFEIIGVESVSRSIHALQQHGDLNQAELSLPGRLHARIVVIDHF